MKLKNKKGISLIVLVITIIVMIVLAAAIILSLSSNGVIGRANEAKTASDVANAKQVVAMANAEWKFDEEKIRAEYGVDAFKDYANKKLNEVGYTTSGNGGIDLSDTGAINTIYIGEDNRKAIIPEGFTVSTDSKEDSVTEGLVIKDSAGNEFVWVPVDVPEGKNFNEVFVRTTTYNGTITAPSNDFTEPFSKTTTDGITLSLTNDLTGEYAEYAEMRASVEKNGGFYIGRYEAGTTAERTNIANGTTEVVVQKNKPVYNYVGWGPSMTDVTGDVTYSGKNQGKGAVELSRNMYKSSPSVVSTLCYGVQWDAALQFIYNTDSTYPTNSTGKGHYGASSTILTGAIEEYKVNNIYDMAGNLWEWTVEAYSNYRRAFRSGCFSYGGGTYPASYRNVYGSPGNAVADVGFRLTLYIK